MLKKTILGLFSGLTLCGVALAAPPQEDVESDPDACGAALCLIGKTREDDCDKYISQYFAIQKFKHGNFSPSRTKSARGKWLDECKDDTAEKKQAHDTWGPVQRGF